MLINAGYRTGSVVEASYTGAYSGAPTISADDAVETQSETVTITGNTADPTALRLGGAAVSFTFSSGTITYTAPLLPNNDTLGVEVDVDSQTLSTTIAYSNTYNHTHTPAVIDDNSILPDSSFGTTELVELKVVTDASSSVLTIDWPGYDTDNFASAVSDFVTAVSETAASTDVVMGYHITEDGTTGTFTRTLSVAASGIVPTAFTLGADVAGAELSVDTDRSFVVAGLDSAQTFTATGDGTVSLTDGSGYGSSVSADTGDTVYFRLPASGSYATAATGGLGCNGVTDAMSVTTRSQVAPALASTSSYTKQINSAASGTLSLTGGDAPASWSDPSGTDGAQYTITSSGVWTRTSDNPTEEDETFTTTATNAAGTSEAQTVTVSYVEQLIGNMWRPSLSSLKIGL